MRQARKLLRKLLSAQHGGFDLGSTFVAVAITATLISAGLFMVLGVVPASQDGAARDALSAPATAQSVANSTDRRYLDKATLIAKRYLSNDGNAAIGIDALGDCYAAVAASETGRLFFVTDKEKDPQELFSTTLTGCLPPADLEAIATGLGATLTASTQTEITLNYADPSFTVSDHTKKIQPSINGGTGPISYSITGTLPAGIVFNPANGEFSKTDGPWASSVQAVETGHGGHNCVIASASIECWGTNSQGQLGDGAISATTKTPSPVIASGALLHKKPTSVSVGGNSTCAIASGEAFCWGANGYGQLGNGTKTASSVPVAVATAGTGMAGKKVTAISVGTNTTCALAAGDVYCWGSGAKGIRGDGISGSSASTTAISTPVPVVSTGALLNKKVTAISVGAVHACVVANSKPYCWGSNVKGALGTSDATLAASSVPLPVYAEGILKLVDTTALSVGGTATAPVSCVVAGTQTACWGSGGSGQLGNDAKDDSQMPVAVAGPLPGLSVSAVSVGPAGACAIADDDAYCWGAGTNGQLGTGNIINSNVPVAVTKVTDEPVTSISASYQGYCLAAGGGAYCWAGKAAPAPVPVPGFDGNPAFPSGAVSVTATDGTTSTTSVVTLGLR